MGMKMICPRSFIAAIVVFASSCAASFAVGVGEPLGFSIQVKQGGVIASDNVTIGPGQDLDDIKVSDGDGESSTQIGTLPGGSPIVLKVVSEDNALYRILHMYIYAPASMENLNSPGPVSLFNASSAFPIDVSISGMTFDNGAQVQPQLANTSAYFASYMRDSEGKFYQLSQANAFNSFGHGSGDIQVGGDKFLDGNSSQYTFDATAGSPTAFAWKNMVNPGLSGQVHNGASLQAPAIAGYVFELGISVAFEAVPEPGTLSLLAVGVMTLACRRSRRRS
jgi:hypothetical protein